MFGWLTFYHQGHEVAEDFKPYMRELQFRIQKVTNSFFDYYAIRYRVSGFHFSIVEFSSRSIYGCTECFSNVFANRSLSLRRTEGSIFAIQKVELPPSSPLMSYFSNFFFRV